MIPAIKPVFLCGAAANRDPEAFTDADTFDIERDQTEAQHVGLGYGIHSCLGAALARMESGSRWSGWSTSCRATRWTGTGANGSTCKTWRAGRHVPVTVLR